MKVLLTTGLLVLLALGICPAQVTAHGPEYDREVAAPGSVRAARPLMRYLKVALSLTPAQIEAVQYALGTRRRHLTTVEELSQRLDPVLSPTEQARLQALQQDVASYERLHYLVARR